MSLGLPLPVYVRSAARARVVRLLKYGTEATAVPTVKCLYWSMTVSALIVKVFVFKVLSLFRHTPAGGGGLQLLIILVLLGVAI